MSKTTNPQDEYQKTAVRLPPELHEEVKRAAKAAGRTMNAELIERIASASERVTCQELLRQNEELKKMMRDIMAAIELLK